MCVYIYIYIYIYACVKGNHHVIHTTTYSYILRDRVWPIAWPGKGGMRKGGARNMPLFKRLIRDLQSKLQIIQTQ